MSVGNEAEALVGAGGQDCPLCEPLGPREQVRLESTNCMVLGAKGSTSFLVVPRAHRTTPFDMTSEEWAELHDLLGEARLLAIEEPQGWNIGWNVNRVGGQELEHVHCHLIPRYADEPYAGRGLRWWFKQPENQRKRPE